MSVIREKTDLDKKPTWFIFLGANVLILLGCAITWILYSKAAQTGSGINESLIWLSTLLSNLLSLVLAGLFMYFEVKDIAPKVMHFHKKWLKWYIAAMSVYVASILFNVLFFLIGIKGIVSTEIIKTKWKLPVYFSITGFLTLVAIGLQRYARFRIDLDVYKRKHGEEIKEKEEKEKLEKANKEQAKKDIKSPVKKDSKLTDKSNKPSGGLLDQMDK